MAVLTRFPKEELLGAKGYEFLVPEDHQDQIKEKLEQRRRGITDQYEFPIKHKDNRQFWVSVRATPYSNHKGEITGSLAAFIDITDKK